MAMTEKQRFIAALERKPVQGLVPHFELVFFLTMEAFGRVHILHRSYSQWDQMSETERELQRDDMADLHIRIAEKYNHSAIFVQIPFGRNIELINVMRKIREKSGDKYFLMTHGDGTYSIPNGKQLEEFVYRIADDPEGVKRDAERMADRAIARMEMLSKDGYLDGAALCDDYCFNRGPFLNPAMFAEFIAPYSARIVKAERDMGLYVIKHTDGNIMPILDQLIQINPHALHSIDPQAGVDIAEVKRIAGDKLCLIGNVNCGLLQTGTDEEIEANVLYALRNGMPGGGYIFSTSNCVYTGMPLRNYEFMLDIWKREGYVK
jgi:uroporphyrinogen decarboxylase